MKLLITGICGFTGSTLAEHWLSMEPGLTLFGIDNLSRSGSEQNRQKLQRLGIRLFHGDLRAASDLETLPVVDWVIDAAANPAVLAGLDGQTSSRQLVEHNLLGTVNLLEYCKRVGAGLILLSTSRVYSVNQLSRIKVNVQGKAFQPAAEQHFPKGSSSAGIREEFSTAPPLSLYGSSKFASETLALEYGEAFGFPVWVNRCGNLAGAGQFGRADQGIFSFWINSWLRRKPLSFIGFEGAGYQVRDGLHPRDLIPLLQQQTCASSVTAERVFNLGGGVSNSISLAELSCWCQDRFGEHRVFAHPEQRRFDIPWLVMDANRASLVWGWRPQTPLNDILLEIAHHAEHHPQWLELSEGK